MKKRTKILAGLSASVLALSAVGFGFSQWSSNITLGGNVNAKGSWDVGITDARITSVSSAVTVDGEASEVAPTATVTVYPVYVQIFPASGESGNYRMLIDDTKPSEVKVTMAQLQEYDEGYTFNNTSTVYNFLVSNKRWGGSFEVKLNELGESLGFRGVGTTNGNAWNEGDPTYEGEIMGYAICNWVNSNVTRPTVTIDDTYTPAKNALENSAPTTYYAGQISEDKQSASYSDVTLAAPGAWAEYAVTVTNNGTANANLSDYTLEVTGVDGAVAVQAPDLAGETLAPGASCTVTFVAQVPADYSGNTLDAQGALNVHLVYAQDAVEAAPAPSVTH